MKKDRIFLVLAVSFLATICFAEKQEQIDKERKEMVTRNTTTNRAKLKKVNEDWVGGCVTATLVYVSKHRKIDDGLSPSYNAETICALISDNEIGRAHV